jgi:coenzyme PQQ precursor peptide PqqA
MHRRLCSLPRRRHSASSGAVPRRHQEITMQWTPPTATDIRLGFEITMYISAR